MKERKWISPEPPDGTHVSAQSPKPQNPDTTRLQSPRRTEGRLSREVQNRIGQQLRAMYDDVLKQGVPDRFSDLLRQLDQPADAAKPDASTASREDEGSR